MSGSVAEAARELGDTTNVEADDDAERLDRGDDRAADLDAEQLPEPEPEPTTLTGRLMEPLDGSIKDDRAGELWDRENGGVNRLVLVAEETFGMGDGMPRAAHAVIGLAEAYLDLADHADAPGGGDDRDADDPAAPDRTEMDPQTQRIMEASSGVDL